MKTTHSILCTLALSSSIGFAQYTVDLSGLESWGTDGDPSNGSRIYQLVDPGPIIDFGTIVLWINYDITIQTFGSSSFSDLNIRFGNSDGTFDGDWPDTFRPGADASDSVTARFTGTFATDFRLNEDGQFHIGLFEGIDDIASGADATLLPGSTMSLSIFIPSPSGVSLLALAGLHAGTRRRRS